MLLPDGELSLFERRLLDAHCSHCAECRAIRDGVDAVTELVRDAPAEDMERPVRVAAVRPRYWRPVSGALASGGAAALALALALWVGPEVRRGPSSQILGSQILSGPVIIATPGSATADSEAIWQLKRNRLVPAPSDTRHTGPVLS